MTPTPVLLALPPELIEAIFIVANSPKTISALARTCRSLHALIYSSPDSHLWRTLFLATWDDPRPALSHLALLDPRAGEREDGWDWGVQYRRRVQGERWLRKWRGDICIAGPEDPLETNTAGNTDSSVLLATLRTLLSSLETLTPFPASLIALTVLTPEISPFPTGNVGSGVGERRERMTTSPALPPLLLLLASGRELVGESSSIRRLGRIVYGPHTTNSKPSVSTPRVPTPCLPPQLTRTLLPSLTIGVRGFHPHTPALTPAEYWENSELADAFHRIVCITGFVPVPPPLTSLSPPPGGGSCASFPSPAAQCADACALARRRVYDMRYLMASRMWGPYHVVRRSAPVTSRHNSGRPTAKERRGGGGLGTLGWALGMDVEIDEEESDDDDNDDEDEDWNDAEDHDSPSSFPAGTMDVEPTNYENDTDEPAGDDADDDEHGFPLISLILSPPTSTSSSGRTSHRSSRSQTGGDDGLFEIKPHHLRPDYTYLASIRIVVEANLRELFGHEDGAMWDHEEDGSTEDLFGDDMGVGNIVTRGQNEETRVQEGMSTGTRTFEPRDIPSKFRTLEVARIGGACGYWSNWVERMTSMPRARWHGDSEKTSSKRRSDKGAGKDDAEREYKGKGKARVVEVVEETEGETNRTVVHEWEDFDAPEGEEVEGWDWAGVTGIWRRCVCWMDYRELLFFNLDRSKFLTVDTQEACRIIPMEVRIEKYTRAGIMPVSDLDSAPSFSPASSESDHKATDPMEEGPSKAKNRFRPRPGHTRYFRPPPVIHFVGSSIGSDRSLDDGRTVRGTVSVIGGGEIRWTLLSFVPHTTKPEWSSEAIQIGGPGSAAGILGMWTGAGHERADPLGPFWAWKVA